MKGAVVFFGMFVVGLIGMSNSSEVAALADTQWTQGGVVKVSSNEIVPYDDDTFCSTSYREIFVSELHEKRRACLYGNQKLSFGMFYQSGMVTSAVLLPFSEDAHVLEGVCSGWNCRYSASEDMLVTQQPVGPFGWGVLIYAHASQRIHRVTNLTTPLFTYTFDTQNPDYTVRNERGQYLSTPAFALSNNGKWLAMELSGKGAAIVDLTTFHEKQILTDGYNAWGQPSQELAISDDGKHVAIAWSNGGFTIVDITPECGQALVGDLSLQTGMTRCRAGDVGIGLMFPNFRAAHKPHFRGNGEQLDLFVVSWVGSSRAVSLVAPGVQTPHKLELLALGDSFVSGQGETDDSQYITGTNSQFDTCHTSIRSYPFLVARVIGVSDVNVRSVACSGATMSDITGQVSTYWGQNGRIGGKGLALSLSEKEVRQEAALDSYQPGRTLQSQFIDRYKPSILTIGIGGNDAGLMGKLRVCVMPGVCEWATGEGLRKTALEIKGLFDKLVTLYGDMVTRSPGTRIYAIGYPDIIKPEGICDPVTGILLSHEERVFMRESLRYMNQVMHAAADKAGITYINVESSLQPKELCNGAVQSAMNGLRLGDDIAVITSVPLVKIIGSETFHPNPLGHALMAAAITQQYPDMGSHNRCGGGVVACPADVSVPEPPPYWGITAIGEGVRAYASEFAFEDAISKAVFTISLANGSLAPGSVAKIGIRSAPTQLGELIVDQAGAVNGTITLPDSVEEGFHTLHLFGVNGNGDPVDLYQFITVDATPSVGVPVVWSSDGSGSGGVSAGEDLAATVGMGNSSRPPTLATAAKATVLPAIFTDTAVLGLVTEEAHKTVLKNEAKLVISSVGGMVEKAVHRVGRTGVIVAIAVVLLLLIIATMIFIRHRGWVKPGG